MPDKQPRVIDGFASVQAVKRSGKGHKPRTRESSNRLHGAPPAAPARSASDDARIGQTAMPVTHELVCYKCDYAFRVRGRIHNTFCPKCKNELDMGNHTIAGKWDVDVKTMGNIAVESGAVVTGALLVAQNMTVAGDVRGATLQVTRRLELCKGARLDFASVTTRDLCIAADASFSWRHRIACRQMEIVGRLTARLQADELVIVRAGAAFEGELVSARLVIEDGATLSAGIVLGVTTEAIDGKARSAA